MDTLILILYFCLFTYLCWRHTASAVLWLIFTLPAYLIRFKIFGLPSTLLEIQILILFLIWLIKNIKNLQQAVFFKFLKQNKLFFIAISLFFLASVISVFIAPHFITALGLWRAYFLEPFLFLIVFVSVIKKYDIQNVFKILSWQILFLSLFAIYQKITGTFISNPFWSAEVTRRVTSVFSYPNALALFLAPIVVMLIGCFAAQLKSKITSYQASKSQKLSRCLFALLSFVTIILGLLAVYFTKSKGALLAIFAGIIFYAIFYKGYRKIFSGILIIVILLSCYLVFSGKINLTGIQTVEGGDSISTRLEMWQETWQMLKTRPLLGAGIAGYQIAVAPWHSKDYIEIYLYPHNIFLNFWTEIGLLGLLSFLGVVFSFFFCCSNKTRNSQLEIIIKASMFTLLIHGLVDVPYFKNDLAILFWIIIGMMIISRRGGRVV